MIPLFSFPTQVVFVDDDPDFLNNLEAFLDKKQASYAFFTSAKKALDYINSEAQFLSQYKFFLEERDTYEWGKQSFFLNYGSIKNIAHDPSRFFQLTTVVADFTMPHMDGLEFLERIKASNVQKILLTGEADEQTAIGAFNKDIINQFIRKQDSNLTSVINRVISDAQRHVFSHLTSALLPATPSIYANPIFQSNPELEEFFAKTIKDNNISEYYLADSQGSFICLSDSDKLSGLFIRTEDQIEALESEILGEASIPHHVQEAITSREKILCYLPSEGQVFPEDHEIEEFLRPAQKFGTDSPTYAAYLEDITAFDGFRPTPFPSPSVTFHS